MTTRSEFQHLAYERLDDADTLLKASRFDGSYYLAGYVVEFALKACICKALNTSNYPSNLVSFKTHKPEELLLLSGLKDELNNDAELFASWQILRKWNPESRYLPVGTQKSAAEAFIRELKSAKGVHTWLAQKW